nr:TM2 domain-containing protein [Noviherbaspirillum massiliense]
MARNAPHKNKTLATLLAFLFGSLGAHRFYLHGKKDFWAWIYLAAFSLYCCFVFLASSTDSLVFSILTLLPLATYAGFIEALVIGLTPDEKWDATRNPSSGRQSDSGWPLAVLLVLTVGVGAVAVIATLARVFDLLYTGGAYG